MARAAVALLALALLGAAGEREITGKVVSVADGDTLTVLVGEQPVRVRLAQIDAPEKGQPWGRRAKRALSELAFGKTARVVVVAEDRYGRSVGEVFVGDVHVNEAMVREGHAWAYTEYSPSLAIIDLENAARGAGRGLWALPESERDAPWIWRRKGRAGKSLDAPDPSSFACGERRTCSQMRSCAEARFHLAQCGVTRLDGDQDGVPCEKLCGRNR